MARFESSGIDGLIEDLKQMGELSGEMADEMLLAGAEAVKQAWRKSAEMHNLRLTGQLIDSISYAKKVKMVSDMKVIDIYPQGMSTYTVSGGKKYARKKPVRNAEIAFIHHYGTSKTPASHWVDTADELSAEPVQEAMTEVYERHLKERNL